jgi:hypothetical protein
VASIIERIDLGCASNPMVVLISLTAAMGVLLNLTASHKILSFQIKLFGPKGADV